MGYSTEFTGELLFVEDPLASQLKFIKSMCGEDCRDHDDWDTRDMTYLDVELTDNWNGIRWDGSEKTYELTEKINFMIKHIRTQFPDFKGFKGEMVANGEEMDDNWIIKCNEDGTVYQEDLHIVGKYVKCPHCDHKFEPKL